jgi:hypothetical protein
MFLKLIVVGGKLEHIYWDALCYLDWFTSMHNYAIIVLIENFSLVKIKNLEVATTKNQPS